MSENRLRLLIRRAVLSSLRFSCDVEVSLGNLDNKTAFHWTSGVDERFFVKLNKALSARWKCTETGNMETVYRDDVRCIVPVKGTPTYTKRRRVAAWSVPRFTSTFDVRVVAKIDDLKTSANNKRVVSQRHRRRRTFSIHPDFFVHLTTIRDTKTQQATFDVSAEASISTISTTISTDLDKKRLATEMACEIVDLFRCNVDPL